MAVRPRGPARPSGVAVIDVYQYASHPPPEPSAGRVKWEARIRAGFRPNRRLRSLGYSGCSEFYRVYVWEYINVLYPLIVELYDEKTP